jgi:hypothetical protein
MTFPPSTLWRETSFKAKKHKKSSKYQHGGKRSHGDNDHSGGTMV